MIIYKYILRATGEQTVLMPVGARILSAGNQFDEVFIWALCDPEKPLEGREVYVFGTGWEMPDNIQTRSFIGTVISDGGNYVWHVFE